MKAFHKYGEDYLRRLFRTIEVPEDLGPLTDIDRESEVPPIRAKLTPEGVDAIVEAFESLYRSGVYPLLTLCIRRHGKIVINRSIGEFQPGKKASVDTPICLFSSSKSITAILIHLLAEQGKINLLNPVSFYIPAFAANGKGSITVQQLLSHRGGVPKVPAEVQTDLLFDHTAALQMVCASEPTDRLGATQAYHAITSGFVFNELIRVTTGMNAQQFLDKYIRKPMGMRYFRYGLTKREQSRVAENTSTGLDSALVNSMLTSVLGAHPDTAVTLSNDPRFYSTVIPSVNLFATAEEVSRFYQMLLDHGSWQGKQILDPLTVHRATRPLGKTELDKALMLPMRYSAGLMMGGTPIGIYGKDTQHAYGHLGYANIFCWADPQRDIAVSLMNTGKPVLGPHLRALPLLLASISEHCTPLVDMEGDVPVYQRPRRSA